MHGSFKVARTDDSCHALLIACSFEVTFRDWSFWRCYYVVRMSALSRIGVAIDSALLEKFDKLIGRRGYTNRSEAFRDLIREELVEEQWESPEAQVVGTVTLVYDH